MTDTQADRLAELEARLDTLTDRLDRIEPKRTGWRAFFAVSDWKDLIKAVGIPLTIALGVVGFYDFYDKVWTRTERQEAAAAAAVQEKMTDLQTLNAELFALNASGEDATSSAKFEALQGRRERLVGEIADFYGERASYFTQGERLMLASELINLGRTDAALRIAEDMRSEAATLEQKVNVELLSGRIYGADGPVHDLGRAREALRASIELAETHGRSAARRSAVTQSLSYWVYLELYRESDCALVTPLAEQLAEVSGADVPEMVEAGLLDEFAGQILDLHRRRCGA